MQLTNATTHCKSLNANQILPRSREESDDLNSALLSLNLDSETADVLVSIGIYKTIKGEWHDSAGQRLSYFNWLPDQPEDLSGTKNYAGLRINGVYENVGWKDYSGTYKLNVVCTKPAGHGKNNP